jgi:hypothetical protein
MARFEDNTRTRIVDEWLAERHGGEMLLDAEQLTGLQLAVGRDKPAEVPDEVMEHWHWLLAVQRRIANQSEPLFIEQARRQGWTWQRIADALGLPDAEAAEQRQAFLEAELVRTLPTNLPRTWVGWRQRAAE